VLILPNITLKSAAGINDCGWTAVTALDNRDLSYHAYILIPQKSRHEPRHAKCRETELDDTQHAEQLGQATQDLGETGAR
jgi:hypothetical protein